MANIINAQLIERNTPKIVSELRYISGKKTSCNNPRLDTLAQLDRFNNSQAYLTLQKRAFAKYYTRKLIFPLIDLKNDRVNMYWNTFHCVDKLKQDSDGKVTSDYCKNRWCIVCNRIRTGILHNTHKKSLQCLNTKFVTLTTNLTKTCVTKQDLENAYNVMLNAFQKVWRKTRTKYGKLKALRKTEVTWKFHRATFHPHFHIIMESNTDEAEYLVSEWLKLFPNADPKAQHISNTTEKVFNETFKYLCKMWNTEYDAKGNYNIVLPYPPDKMDNIFEVFRGKRIIQTYGLKKVELEDFDEEIHATVFTDEARDYNSEWVWYQDCKTWIDESTGEFRTEWKDFSKKEFNSE